MRQLLRYMTKEPTYGMIDLNYERGVLGEAIEF